MTGRVGVTPTGGPSRIKGGWAGLPFPSLVQPPPWKDLSLPLRTNTSALLHHPSLVKPSVSSSLHLYTYKPFSLFWDILFFKEGKRKTILLNRFTGLNIINVFFFCASRISIHRIWGALEVEWKMEPFGYFFMYFPSMKWGSPLISEQCELNEVWQCEVYQVRIVEVKSNSGTWSLTWSTVPIQRNWLAILTYKFASCAETKWTSFFPLTLKFKNDF